MLKPPTRYYIHIQGGFIINDIFYNITPIIYIYIHQFYTNQQLGTSYMGYHWIIIYIYIYIPITIYILGYNNQPFFGDRFDDLLGSITTNKKWYLVVEVVEGFWAMVVSIIPMENGEPFRSYEFSCLYIHVSEDVYFSTLLGKLPSGKLT